MHQPSVDPEQLIFTSAERGSRGEHLGLELIDVALVDDSRYMMTNANGIIHITLREKTSSMDVEPRIGQTDGFPALDFKFHNQGSRKDLLTKVVIDVHRATVDYTPILGTVISCNDGDVVLYVSNNGWGDAEDFKCEVDLEPFGAAVQSRTVLVTAPKIPAEADKASSFVLVSHQQIDTAAMPSGLRNEEHRLLYTPLSRFDYAGRKAASSSRTSAWQAGGS